MLASVGASVLLLLMLLPFSKPRYLVSFQQMLVLVVDNIVEDDSVISCL